MSGNQLSSEEVDAGRLDEVERLLSYDVYETAPIEQCWNSIGRVQVNIKWVDINKDDKVNHDYRSRLVAKELKLDKRLDLFAAKTALFNAAVAEGIGYKSGNWSSGMKKDVVDISRSFFHADAIREVYVDLPSEDSEQGMCGRLKKSMHGTPEAAQNWGYACTQLMKDEGFLRGLSSPCVFLES